jgi:hypothetical protein
LRSAHFRFSSLFVSLFSAAVFHSWHFKSLSVFFLVELGVGVKRSGKRFSYHGKFTRLFIFFLRECLQWLTFGAEKLN